MQYAKKKRREYNVSKITSSIVKMLLCFLDTEVWLLSSFLGILSISRTNTASYLQTNKKGN